jgi:pachytene checkpoint protein 2
MNDTVLIQRDLPNDEFARAWDSIKVEPAQKQRLVAQAVLAFEMRKRFRFEVVPVHGLIVLAGPPGNGKTTLARGLANETARLVRGRVRFLEIDPHVLSSSSLGKSQREVTKLFHQTIPEHTTDTACVVLMDEVESLAADRGRLSLEANPIDVHRATDAVLAGVDALTREHRNTLLLATTNFEHAVDRALLSRADAIERLGPPNAEARRQIIDEMIAAFAGEWPTTGKLKKSLPRFVEASDGLDGRRLRKALVAAFASTIETARDPNCATAEHVLTALASFTRETKEAR